jgi:hypothetical protein
MCGDGLVRLVQPLPMQIALPSDPPEQLVSIRLPLVPREQPQARLDDLAFGSEAGRGQHSR